MDYPRGIVVKQLRKTSHDQQINHHLCRIPDGNAISRVTEKNDKKVAQSSVEISIWWFDELTVSTSDRNVKTTITFLLSDSFSTYTAFKLFSSVGLGVFGFIVPLLMLGILCSTGCRKINVFQVGSLVGKNLRNLEKIK
jgi:hypothetical protein